MDTNENRENISNVQPEERLAGDFQTEGGLQKQVTTQSAQLRAKSELIDSMIYQIRTLSNAVIGFSDLLSTEPLSPDQTEYVQEIQHAGEGLSALVNDVLDWAQLLSGKIQITKTKFYTLDIIKEIQKVLSSAAQEKGLDYQIVTDPEMPAYISGDQERLLKCILSLAISAAKYTQQGNVQLHIYSEQTGDNARICFDVINRDAQIAPEEVDGIFEPTNSGIGAGEESFLQFSHGQTVTAGLPLVKLLSEAMGGTLDVVSRVGEGTMFSLRTPSSVDPANDPKLGSISWEQDDERPDEVPQEEALPEEPPQEEESSCSTVLLVEDQHSSRTVISLMLAAMGIQVETAEDGEEALVRAGENTYDLILMDIKMPRMDGYEATRQIREKGIQAPIVALSAKVFDEQEHHQISTLFDGFLAKPVDSRKLAEMLKKFISCLPVGDTSCSEEKMAVVYNENVHGINR